MDEGVSPPAPVGMIILMIFKCPLPPIAVLKYIVGVVLVKQNKAHAQKKRHSSHFYSHFTERFAETEENFM